MADDGEAQLLTRCALAVVHSRQRHERLLEPDKTYTQRSVPEHLTDLLVHAKIIRADPHTLSHQERVIVDALFALDVKPVLQLAEDKVEFLVERCEEILDRAALQCRAAGG